MLAGLSQAQQLPVTIERDVPAKMRDGVVLKADIYRPKADGKYPVILQRSPYNKTATPVYQPKFAMKAAARGYVVIFQDCRGRFASAGEWNPFRHEAEDGYDSVEWAAQLPYSNGKVGMVGASYVGATQLMAAVMQPPHLAGIFPMVMASNYYEGLIYQGGTLNLWLTETWTSGLALGDLLRYLLLKRDTMGWTRVLPLRDFPVLAVPGREWVGSYFREWLAHPSYDDYWKQISIEDRHDKIQVPAFHFGAWYDIVLGGTLRNYLGIKAHGATEAARRGQRLLIGPWPHGPWESKVGELDFGPQANFSDLGEDLVLRWYDHVLKGTDNGIDKEKPVRLFVMGDNVWRDEDDWPLARAQETRYYFHSQGKANSAGGNGSLTVNLPAAEPTDQYVYDPANPVPTRGGPLCCENAVPAGPWDQRPVEEREDVLVFTSPAFEKDYEVTGPVRVELFASSSAVDTDFTAKLVDVWPNGYAQNLTEGILRARFRNSLEKPELMRPGEIYKFNIDLWATSNVFKAGHRLRVQVSSSNFPRFARNLNTGGDLASDARVVKATNTIYHDAQHPSAIVLPVVAR